MAPECTALGTKAVFCTSTQIHLLFSFLLVQHKIKKKWKKSEFLTSLKGEKDLKMFLAFDFFW